MNRLTTDPMVGYSMWLDREDWGHIYDGLLLSLEAARQRKASNPESTSDARAAEIVDLINRLGTAAATR